MCGREQRGGGREGGIDEMNSGGRKEERILRRVKDYKMS